MYQYLKSQNLIQGFSVYQNRLYTCDLNHTLHVDGKWLLENIDGFSLVQEGVYLCFFSNSITESITYYVKDDSVQTIQSGALPHTLYDDTILIYQLDPQFFYTTISLYDLIHQRVLKTIQKPIYPARFLRIAHQLIYWDEQTGLLKNLNLKTEVETLLYNYEQKTIYQLELITNETLLVYYKGGINLLNINAKQIIWENNIEHLGTLEIHPSKPFITSISENIFIEVDLKTGQIQRQGVLAALEAHDLKGRLFKRHGNYLYFSAIQAQTIPVIGILNTQNLELLWWEPLDTSVQLNAEETLLYKQLSQEKGRYVRDVLSITAPVMVENRLYVLDARWKLHIYEKKQVPKKRKSKKNYLTPIPPKPKSPKPPVMLDKEDLAF